MNVKTVEGLVGARTNIDLSDTPMGVFRQAREKGDTAVMERALGYAGDMVETAGNYQTKAEEGMKADAEEAARKAKADLEKAAEHRKEEQEKLEKQIESSQTPDIDTVDISESSKTTSDTSENTEFQDSGTETSAEPVIYTKNGELHSQSETSESSITLLA